MNRCLSFLVPLVVVLLLASSLDARAEVRAIRRNTEGRRVALVIGNGGYAKTQLKNPVNDARDMAEELKSAGFKTTCLMDAGKREMNAAIAEFGQRLDSAQVGLFFFAGHGMQVNGRNYLLPIGAEIRNEAEVEYEAVDANRVLSQMNLARAEVNIVILDACRDNPYRSMFRSVNSNGLANLDAPKGTLIAYATSPGKVAADGRGRNSPYTKHLLHAVRTSLPIEIAFKQVRARVMGETGGKQVPWESSSLVDDFFFKAPGAGDVRVAAKDDSDAELLFWRSIMDSDQPALFREYLAKYPDGQFASVARFKAESLSAPAFPATVAEMGPSQEGWVMESTVAVDAAGEVWLKPDGPVRPSSGDGYVVRIKREAKGTKADFVLDISRSSRKWTPGGTLAGDYVTVKEILY